MNTPSVFLGRAARCNGQPALTRPGAKAGVMYRRPTAHSSCCSARTAPTRRRTAGRLGKMPTTSVRRRISLLRRSCGLLDQIFFQWASGKLEKGQDVGSGLVQ